MHDLNQRPLGYEPLLQQPLPCSRRDTLHPCRRTTAGNGPPPLGIVNSAGRVAGEALPVGTWTRVEDDTPAPAGLTKIATTRRDNMVGLRSCLKCGTTQLSGFWLS